MTKISQLPSIGANLAADDEFVIRDVSDGSTPNKKVTASGFIDYVINQGTGSGFTQIAAGAGPLARVQTTSSGTTGTIVFGTASAGTISERARLDASGRLLVGTSSSSTNDTLTLQANSGSSTGNATIRLRRGATPGAADQLVGFIGFEDSSANIGASISALSDGGAWTSGSNHRSRLVFSTTASGASSPTERVRVDSSGRVGINTASPIQPLHVLGNSLTEGRVEIASATPEILFTVPLGGLDSRIHNDGNGNLIFGTGTNSTTPTERARITSDGYLRLASGTGGIQFGGDTAAANALNDYEEGTFTPSDASGDSLSFTSVSGFYTKIGRQVVCQGFLTYPSTASTTQARIGGLPFIGSNGGGFSMYLTGTTGGFVMRSQNSTSTARITSVGDNDVAVTNAGLSGAIVQFTFIYQVGT